MPDQSPHHAVAGRAEDAGDLPGSGVGNPPPAGGSSGSTSNPPPAPAGGSTGASAPAGGTGFETLAGTGVHIPGPAGDGRADHVTVAAATLTTSTTRLDTGAVLLSVRGELDLATSPRLQSAVLAEVTAPEPPTAIALDLAELSFIDAVGIGSLVHCREAAHRLGIGFSVHNPRGMTRRLLEIFHLTGPLRVHPPAPDHPAGGSTGHAQPGADPAGEISRCG